MAHGLLFECSVCLIFRFPAMATSTWRRRTGTRHGRTITLEGDTDMLSRQTPKPYRRRLLHGWYQTLNDSLRTRVSAAARRQGVPCPSEDSSSYLRIALAEAPGLLERVRHIKRMLGTNPCNEYLHAGE
jgi:hypothetical protein